jgi:tRNA nucleotidyltransferase (CCA-adding enzyme)
VHHFITEKFGTITLIPKDNGELKYELTPLRMENDYSDNRHPEKINWHDDILLDSNRRDFSINSIYYFSTDIDNRLLTKEFKHTLSVTNQDEVLKSLNKSGVLFYADMNLFIVQDQNYISKLFPQ